MNTDWHISTPSGIAIKSACDDFPEKNKAFTFEEFKESFTRFLEKERGLVCYKYFWTPEEWGKVILGQIFKTSFNIDTCRNFLIDLWPKVECPGIDKNEWLELFRLVGFCGDSDVVLPDKLVVYRGGDKGLPIGISWTTNKMCADWFALKQADSYGCHLQNPQPVRFEAQVPHAAVLGHFHGHGEQEFVIDPDMLVGIKVFEIETIFSDEELEKAYFCEVRK